MSTKIFYLLFFLIGICSWGQELKPYQIYSKKNKKVDFGTMIKKLSQYDVVLFGEHHNNSINHWLQLETTEALFQLKKEKLILGAEMFERDNQAVLNTYLEGTIDEEKFITQSRLWNNYHTDYKPLVNFAKKHKLKFIATNIPRRYASIVAKKGIDSLYSISSEEKKFMVKLPFEIDLQTPGYAEMKEMMKDHSSDLIVNFIAAQAIKDATMAESILENYTNDFLILHFNGDYHSKRYGGIPWYLVKKKKNLKIAVLSIFTTEDKLLKIPLTENEVLTEFNIVIPSNMTKTFE